MSGDKSTLCPAKWLHVSIKLETGQNHSCHYPPTHQVSLQEVQKNPDAFHHSEYKEKQRSLMRKGKRPSECDYCWDLEDQHLPSPRHGYLQRYSQFTGYDKRPHPKYLEVSFSSTCQMKCMYCNPQTSSALAQEYEKYGPYLYEETAMNKEGPTYTEEFWSWFPTVYDSLEDLRITGGEPFLDHNLDRLCNFIEKHPHPSLKLAINSNLSIPEKTLLKYIHLIEELIEKKCLASCTYFTSLDSWGEQASYIRHGLNFKRWQNNIDHILCHSHAHVVVTNTFNLLSIPGTYELIKNLSLYPQDRVHLTFSRLIFPHYLSITNASEREVALLMEQQRMLLLDHLDYTEEINRFIAIMRSEIGKRKATRQVQRTNLKEFILEYDRRKQTSFCEVFPELRYLVDESQPLDRFVHKTFKYSLRGTRKLFPRFASVHHIR